MPDVCVVVDMDDPAAADLTRSGPLAGTATEIHCVTVPVTSGLPLAAARMSAGSGARLAEAASALRVASLDTLSGLREVRAFGAEDRSLALVQSRDCRRVAIGCDRT